MLPVKRLKLDQSIEKKSAQSRNTTLEKSIESFTSDLFKCMTNDEKGNFVCSGLSIHLGLSMCALGARGNTAKEMQQALRLENSTLDDFKTIVANFEKVQDIELNVANRIFIDQSIVVKDSFKNDVSEFFSSDVIDVDFANQPKHAVNHINNWVSKKTNNKIKAVLSEDDISATTKMILTSAVYLKACWQEHFTCIKTEPFFIDKDTTIDVSMIKHSYSYMYKDLKRWKAEGIQIPYRNGRYIFVIIKPKDIDGLQQLQNHFHEIQQDYNDKLGEDSKFEYKDIHLTLPKFKIQSDMNLDKFLSTLRTTEMFTEQANFKGISEEPLLIPPLHIDGIAQKAFIEVNEKGTEAAAVSYIRLRGGGGPMAPKQWYDFKVDRPFLYWIANRECNLTLFCGRVVKPEYN